MSENVTSPELTGFNTYILVVIVIAADIVTVLNNIVIIAVILSSSRFRDMSGVLICNQAVADIGVGLTMLTYSIKDEADYHDRCVPVTLGWMRLSVFVFYSSSMQMLAAVSWNLCVAICNPHYYSKHITKKRVTVFILGSWMVNIVLGLFDLKSDTFYKSKALPHMFVADQRQSEWWIIALDLTVLLILPLAIASVSFIKIFWYTRHVGNMPNVNSLTSKYIRQAMSVLVIGIVYMLTFMPVVVTQIILKNKTAQSYVYSVIALTVVLVNYSYMVFKLPLFLALFRPYRDVVKRFLCCTRRRVHVTEPRMDTSEQQVSVTQATE